MCPGTALAGPPCPPDQRADHARVRLHDAGRRAAGAQPGVRKVRGPHGALRAGRAGAGAPGRAVRARVWYSRIGAQEVRRHGTCGFLAQRTQSMVCSQAVPASLRPGARPRPSSVPIQATAHERRARLDAADAQRRRGREAQRHIVWRGRRCVCGVLRAGLRALCLPGSDTHCCWHPARPQPLPAARALVKQKHPRLWHQLQLLRIGNCPPPFPTMT